MSQFENNPYQSSANYGHDPIASAAVLDDRLVFVRNTYLHLFGAVVAFVALEVIIFRLVRSAVRRDRDADYDRRHELAGRIRSLYGCQFSS